MHSMLCSSISTRFLNPVSKFFPCVDGSNVPQMQKSHGLKSGDLVGQCVRPLHQTERRRFHVQKNAMSSRVIMTLTGPSSYRGRRNASCKHWQHVCASKGAGSWYKSINLWVTTPTFMLTEKCCWWLTIPNASGFPLSHTSALRQLKVPLLVKQTSPSSPMLSLLCPHSSNAIGWITRSILALGSRNREAG
jgi:hypothetical protein